MGDSVFSLLNDLENRDATRNSQQYPMTQPQFKAPVWPVPSRDRYRAPRRDDDVYDVPDDEDLYGGSAHLDAFDQELLRQPYDDRQKQAARGRGRLSFPPNASKYFGAPASSRPNASFNPQQGVPRDFKGQQEYHQLPNRNFPQFACGTTQPQESSSDPQLDAFSSPAFKAGQRRADSCRLAASDRPRKLYNEDDQCHVPEMRQRQTTIPAQDQKPLRPVPDQTNLPHTPPMIQGIPLVFVSTLPDRLRAIFPFPTFNAVQSKCFGRVYNSDDNFVLASPTGSGKTAVLELAICRTLLNNDTGQYKIIYQAPIKALCSERQRDWQKKFSVLGLNCVELTGDSDSADLRNVQTADIIITTPEKWDSITRKWKDHEKLMRLIKLFLIDEVHVLKEDRGATLEAVVSRMKTIGIAVRFIALSATVPNSKDVATWLGKNAAEPYKAAHNEKFGEEFRPVRLKKHVCGYPSNTSNDFQFDNFLDSKLPDVIGKYSENKPIMIFCLTRSSTVSTAKRLATWWSSSTSRYRYWKQPSKVTHIKDHDLSNCVKCGIAFHHAGVDMGDRLAVEKGYLDGDISVICCTSTLAVGVNLPCHFAIIKNTVRFSDSGTQEYSDLEIMQMIGRAGRPQFDQNAVAVIMTRQAKVRRYEAMVTGQDILESCLHLGLIEHLNAEVVLGTIHDLESAKKWLSGTFLFVRLKQNPSHYRLEGAKGGQSIDEQLDDICLRDLTLLQESHLVIGGDRFRCTDFGDAMARYYVSFETMQIFMGLQQKAQISEILSALSQAAELKCIRLRAGEKSFYKHLNQSPSIRFPIPVSLGLAAHKISIIIQSILGAADILWDKDTAKHRNQYGHEVATVFKQLHRLIRCVIDCQICLGDSVAIGNALLLQRSICAQAWDDAPIHMKQISDIGVVSVRKLVNASIRSIEELELAEPSRIEMILGRNPPFGMKLLERLKSFPKLRVSVQATPDLIKQTADGVKIQMKVEIGFLNAKPPNSWQGRPVYVCLLAETSDGRKAHFARISGQKLGMGQDLVITALLTSPDQSINCYVMCDEIAGTMRGATMNPKIALSMFPAPKPSDPIPAAARLGRPTSNMSKRRTESIASITKPGSDEFDDGGIDDDDLAEVSFQDLDFDHIDNYANPTDALTRKNTAKNRPKIGSTKRPTRTRSPYEDDDEPKQLENGKWACNHKCKDKHACKHLCCKEGTDKPPVKRVKKTAAAVAEDVSRANPKKPPDRDELRQTKLHLKMSKRKSSENIEMLDLTQQDKRRKTELAMNGPKDYRNLHQLHKNIQTKDLPSSIISVRNKKPAYQYGVGGEHMLSFLASSSRPERLGTGSSDYGDLQIEELSSNFEESTAGQGKDAEVEAAGRENMQYLENRGVTDNHSDVFGDEDSLLREAMIGLADSQDIQATTFHDEGIRAVEDPWDDDYGYDPGDEDFDIIPAPNVRKGGLFFTDEVSSSTTRRVPTPPTSAEKAFEAVHGKAHSAKHDNPKGAKSILEAPVLEKLNLPRRQHQPNALVRQQEEMTEEKENVLSTNSGHGTTEVMERQKKEVPNAFRDLEPWLFAEFGDIVELVDN